MNTAWDYAIESSDSLHYLMRRMPNGVGLGSVTAGNRDACEAVLTLIKIGFSEWDAHNMVTPTHRGEW